WRITRRLSPPSRMVRYWPAMNRLRLPLWLVCDSRAALRLWVSLAVFAWVQRLSLSRQDAVGAPGIGGRGRGGGCGDGCGDGGVVVVFSFFSSRRFSFFRRAASPFFSWGPHLR